MNTASLSDLVLQRLNRMLADPDANPGVNRAALACEFEGRSTNKLGHIAPSGGELSPVRAGADLVWQRLITEIIQELTQGLEERFLTKRDVAALLQVTPRTVDNMLARGHLSYIRIGRTIRFCRKDLQALQSRFRVERPGNG